MRHVYNTIRNLGNKAAFAALLVLFGVLLSQQSAAQFYNGSQMDFGKNRVQYEKTDWFFYRFDRFDVYFYQGGENLAEYTMRASDRALHDLEKTFD